MKIKKLGPIFIGFLILIGLLYFIGFERISSQLSGLDINNFIYYFVLALFAFFIVEILASLKLKLISDLKFRKILLSHLGGMFLSQITPARIGYVYTAYSLAKKENKSISKKVGLIALVQGVMLSVKIIVLLVAIIFISLQFRQTSELVMLLFMGLTTIFLMLLVLVFILYTKKSKAFFSKIPLVKKFVKYIDLMQDAVKKVPVKKAFIMIVLDLGGWLFYGLQFYFIANSLNLPLSFIICLMLHPIISAVLFVPLSPSALGIAESGNEIIFNLLGLALGTGVVFLLVFRLNTIIVDSIGIIDLKIVKIPKKIKDKIF